MNKMFEHSIISKQIILNLFSDKLENETKLHLMAQNEYYSYYCKCIHFNFYKQMCFLFDICTMYLCNNTSNQTDYLKEILGFT